MRRSEIFRSSCGVDIDMERNVFHSLITRIITPNIPKQSMVRRGLEHQDSL